MPAAALLNRRSQQAIVLAAAANHDETIECGGNATLVIEADISGAAPGDLAVVVNPVSEDGEIYPLAQPPVQSIGPTLSGGRVYYWAQFDVTAQQRVRVRVTNNNAAQQSLDFNWRMA